MTDQAGATGQTGKGGGGGFLVGLVVGLISGALVTAVIQPLLEAGPVGSGTRPDGGEITAPSGATQDRDRDPRAESGSIDDAIDDAEDAAAEAVESAGETIETPAPTEPSDPGRD